jgi:integrase
MASKKCDGLYKRGRIYWASRDPVTNKALSSKCSDLEAARMWLRERERIRSNPAYAASRAATFGDWAQKFLAGKATKSAATQQFNASKVKAILTVIPADTALNTIDPGFIDDYVAARLNSDGKRPPKAYTVVREVRIVIAILAKAKRKGVFAGDLEALGTDLEGTYTPRERSLTPEEVVAFLAALPNARWRAMASVCVALGCRLSEAARLAPEDVELDAGVVWIDGRKTADSNRTLPILSPYRALLESALKDLPFGKVANVDRTFKAAAKKAEIPNLSPNDLRRTHATLNSVMGLPDDMIARLLGHSSVSMTKRTYNRARSILLAPVAERLLEQGNPVSFATNHLQSSDITEGKPQKHRENANEYRPPEPKVAGSNLAWRAKNPAKPVGQKTTAEAAEQQPWPGVTTIGLQSPAESPSALPLGLYQYETPAGTVWSRARCG